MSTVSVKELHKNHFVISFQIQSSEVQKDFEKNLKSHAQKSVVDGFRQGKVPLGLIKKMKGNTILTQVLMQQVEQQLGDYIKENKWSIVGQPMMMNLPDDIQHSTDKVYTFDFEVGTKPPFAIASIVDESFEFPLIELDEQKAEEEIQLLRRRFGKMDEQNEEIKSDEDIVHIAFEPKIANTEIQTLQETFLVKHFKEQVRGSLIGKKTSHTWEGKLIDVFEKQELDWVLKSFKTENINLLQDTLFNIKIERISSLIPAELNESFFKNLDPSGKITNAEELSQEIKKQIEQQHQKAAEEYLQNLIYLHWMKNTHIDLPESFLKKWHQQTQEHKHDESHHHGHDHHHHEHNDEKFHTFLKQLKWSLIAEKIAEEQKIQADQNKIIDRIREDVKKYYPQSDAKQQQNMVMQLLNNQDYLFSIQRTLLNQAIFEWAATQVKRDEKKFSQKDFEQKTKELESSF